MTVAGMAVVHTLVAGRTQEAAHTLVACKQALQRKSAQRWPRPIGRPPKRLPVVSFSYTTPSIQVSQGLPSPPGETKFPSTKRILDVILSENQYICQSLNCELSLNVNNRFLLYLLIMFFPKGLPGLGLSQLRSVGKTNPSTPKIERMTFIEFLIQDSDQTSIRVMFPVTNFHF